MRPSLLLALLLAAPIALASPSEKKPELSKEKERAVVAAYHALQAPEPDSKKIEKLPAHEQFARIDVSERVRSASFGHRTWLLVPPHGRHFYVEFGKSTNTPAGLFGPFDVKPATATEKTPGEKSPADKAPAENAPPASKTQP